MAGWDTVGLRRSYEAATMVTARRERLDAEIATMAADSEFAPVVTRLGCLRGISVLTGFGLAVEIGDWHRFTGNTIGSFVGLTPSEHSSGQSRSQGGVVKTGNAHARRLLVEAAWHHRSAYRPGKTMLDRWKHASPAAQARGDAGNRRLIGSGLSTCGVEYGVPSIVVMDVTRYTIRLIIDRDGIGASLYDSRIGVCQSG